MKQRAVPWDDATLTELKMFAAQSLGIMSMPNIGEAAIRAKIRAAFSGDTITILVPEDEARDRAPDAPQAAPPAPPSDGPTDPSRRTVLKGAAVVGAAAAVAVAPSPRSPAGQPFAGKPLRGSSAENDPKVKVTIAEMEGAGGKRAVPVGVNGVIMLVPRGRPVDIPYRYFMALKCAVKTLHEQDEETNEITSTEVDAYPMSVNKMPDQADIDAYLALEQTPPAAA